MYYRFKTSLWFLYGIDYAVDKALSDGVQSGLESVDSRGPYLTTATFKNGTIFTFWNENKYYAWMKRGTFKFENGSQYHYDNARPSAKTMYLMMCALKGFDYNNTTK